MYIKMRINRFIALGFLSLGTSCSSTFHVIDDYCVSNEYDNNQLFCNPGCNNMFVEYVKSIRWNTKNILVEQLLPDNRQNWYLITAKDETLNCNCYDTLYGPFSQGKRDSILAVRGIDTLKMERKVWRTPY